MTRAPELYSCTYVQITYKDNSEELKVGGRERGLRVSLLVVWNAQLISHSDTESTLSETNVATIT